MQSASSSQVPANTFAVKQNGKLYNTYKEACLAASSKLNGRYYKSLILFSLASAVLFQARLTFSIEAILGLFSWKTWMFALVIFLAGVVISFIRNLTFTVFEPTYPSCLAAWISNVTSLDNMILLGIHSVLNIIIIRYYFSWVAGESYTQNLLLQPPGHYSGARQLNQENIFITFYAIILAVGYTIRYVVNRSYVVKINYVQQPYFQDIKTSTATLLCNSASMAITYFFIAWASFGFLKNTFYYFIATLVGSYHRVLDTPIVGFNWFDLHLFLRLIVAGTVAMSTHNMANRIYDAVYSTNLQASQKCTNQFEGLITGLKDPKVNIKVAAFSELAELVMKSPEKRVELFRSVGKEAQGNTWHQIMEQCLNEIKALRTLIDIEYNGVQPVIAPAPVNAPAEPQQVRNRLPISNKNFYASHIDRIALLDDRTNTIFSDVAETVEGVPSPLPKVVSLANSTRTNIMKSQMIDMLKRLELNLGRSGYFSNLYTETVDRRIQTAFNKYQLTVWAIQSIGTLTAASYKEDPYGFVQADLNTVVNQLLGCLVDVEAYLDTPPIQYNKLRKNANTVIGESEAVVLALREALYQIRLSFDEFLSEFQVEPKYVTKWQRFATYQE